MRQTSRAASMLLLTVVMVVMAASPTWAQLYSGAISGIVQDPTGAVVPRAAVTLTDVTKNFSYHTTTDNSGRYSFRSLQPSLYSLRIEASGFSVAEVDNITLNVNGDVAQDAKLQVGKTSETIEVSQSGAAQVQSEDASTGQTIDRKYVNDLPLIGRSAMDLAILPPASRRRQGRHMGRPRLNPIRRPTILFPKVRATGRPTSYSMVSPQPTTTRTRVSSIRSMYRA